MGTIWIYLLDLLYGSLNLLHELLFVNLSFFGCKTFLFFFVLFDFLKVVFKGLFTFLCCLIGERLTIALSCSCFLSLVIAELTLKAALWSRLSLQDCQIVVQDECAQFWRP